jgi:hypothetical protein
MAALQQVKTQTDQFHVYPVIAVSFTLILSTDNVSAFREQKSMVFVARYRTVSRFLLIVVEAIIVWLAM